MLSLIIPTHNPAAGAVEEARMENMQTIMHETLKTMFTKYSLLRLQKKIKNKKTATQMTCNSIVTLLSTAIGVEILLAAVMEG